MKTILRALLLFAALAGTAMATPNVATMPSFTQRTTYGKATMNSPITVWGRAWNLSTTTTPTYTISFGDGTSNVTGNVSTASGDTTRTDAISTSHTFATAGSKTITITVTDSTGSTSQQSVVRVLPSPTHADKVDMAIEKGLLYLYGSVQKNSQTDWTWYSSNYNDEYAEGIIAFCALAYEENGHSPFNDPVQDVYVYLLQRIHTHMLAHGGFQTLNAHSDGTATRTSDTNGNGKGAYFLARTYSDCARAMALMNPFTSAAQAQTTYIASGSPFYSATGVHDTSHAYSYFDLLTDFTDTLLWSQGDGPTYQGAYGYVLNTQQQARYDGSAQQWPALTMLMAKDIMGISTPQWWADNGKLALEHLMDADGGVEYSDPNGGAANTGKTGGGLTILKVDGVDSTSADGVKLLSYLGAHWDDAGVSGIGASGWTGYWYGTYGIKKGMALQGLNTIKVGATTRDWYQEMSGWLLGDATLLASTLSPSQRNAANMFGQYANGSWTSSSSWTSSTDVDTAISVLTLTTSVTSPPPVPVIAAVPVQSTTGPFTVTLDATGSYSTDPNREIVEYLWDFDSSDGLNWTTPDASGPLPTIAPAYLHSVGTHTVTLRVKDNSNPAQYATTTTVITVANGDVPPVAVPVASNAFQGYNGQPGAAITLDGSQSYDINGDAITLYSWDLNGDGIFGDATGPSVVFQQAQAYTGQIGLKVTANGATSLPVYVDVQVASTNLSLGTVTATNVTAGATATFSFPVTNDATSGLVFNNVLIRLYNGNPLQGGVPIADASASTTVSLASGQTSTVTMSNVVLGGATTVYAYLDPLNTIPESNKNDNVAFCLGLQPQNITFGALATQTLTSPDFPLTGTASSGLAVSYVSTNPSVATVVSDPVSGYDVHIVGPGTTIITASQAGNGTYLPAANVNQLLSVSRYALIINFPVLPTVATTSANFDPGATATNDPTNLPTYTSSNTAVATIVNGQIHPVAVGTSVITANFAADANYLAGSATQTLTVIANALQSVSVPANNNYKESDNLTFTANYLLPVTVSGTPYISIKVGSTMRQAMYVSGSGTSQIKFTYVVVSSDFDGDGIDMYSPINQNGGGMTNTGGSSSAPLVFSVPNTTGITVGGLIFMTSQVNTAPNTTPGTVIDYWDSIRSGMVINTNGAVAFRAHLTLDAATGVTANNFQGIWKAPLGTSASTMNVCRTSDVAPDCNGAVFDMLTENPYINDVSQITFGGVLRAGVGVTPATSMGVWSELGGAGLHKVVRGGDMVAGSMVSEVAPDGWIVTSDVGTMAFATSLTNGLSALVRGSASGGAFTLTTIAKEGAAAPATGGGTSDTFTNFLGNSTDPRMNRLDGNLAFFAGLTSGNAGVWYMPNGGALASVVRTGDKTPDNSDTFTSVDRPSLTSDTLYVRANMASGVQSVWKCNPAVPSSLTLVTKTNDTSASGRVTNVPAGSKIWSVWAPFSNVNGKVTFRVSLYDGVSETRAIVADTDGTLKIVAKVGDAAPGTSGTFVNFDHPEIGDNNQVVFSASTSDGVTAIWRQNSNGGALVRVFAIGDVLNISGVNETIQSIILPGSATNDRMSEWTTIDKNGRVLAHATYQSGKTGVLLSAPSS